MSMQALIATVLPYCGQPPAPEDLAAAWNTDWRLAAVLAVLGAAGWWVQRRKLYMAGWAVMVLAFVSPLCALTSALFAARSAHHLLLLTVVAPLLGAALPQWRRRLPSAMALLLTVLALGLWHVPVVYTWAWQWHSVYWLMQLALLLPAIVFWAHCMAVLQRGSAQAESGVVAVLAQIGAMAGVMGLIGAVLTFAPRVLYPEHGLAPLAYGLQPLQDQQLGGLLMWAPGLLPLALIAGVVLRSAWRTQAPFNKVAPL